MYYSKEQIIKFKKTPISSYLNSLGIQPVKESSDQLLYRSPLTNEKSASFYVHTKKNVFNCFSSGEKGDVIRLVSIIEKEAFGAALTRLASFNPEQVNDFPYGGQNAPNLIHKPSNSSKLILLDDNASLSPTLTNYVSSRAIPMALTKQYLHGISYQNGMNHYLSVGFRTDKGSYALRSEGFKGWLGQSAIRTIAVLGSNEVNLFEGFFDYLSALTYFKRLKPSFTTVVLNSTANLKQALELLEVAKSINCYLDNDTSGRGTLAKLQRLGLPVKDRSTVYQNYKDFNEMLQQQYDVGLNEA